MDMRTKIVTVGLARRAKGRPSASKGARRAAQRAAPGSETYNHPGPNRRLMGGSSRPGYVGEDRGVFSQPGKPSATGAEVPRLAAASDGSWRRLRFLPARRSGVSVIDFGRRTMVSRPNAAWVEQGIQPIARKPPWWQPARRTSANSGLLHRQLSRPGLLPGMRGYQEQRGILSPEEARGRAVNGTGGRPNGTCGRQETERP
jgi:hypothetical protein